MHNSPQFQKLRRTHRVFAFPMTVAFFLWFAVYVFTAVYAAEWMAQPMWGMNIGIWFGLAQFVTTFLITYLYIIYANKTMEPQAAAIREEMEG